MSSLPRAVLIWLLGTAAGGPPAARPMEFLIQPIGRREIDAGPCAAKADGRRMVEEQEVAEQQRAVDNADAQIFVANEAAADRRVSSPPMPELSTGKMHSRVPGWYKRLMLELFLQSLI